MNDVFIRATEYQLMDWADAESLPSCAPPQNLERLLSDSCEGGSFRSCLVLNSRWLPNPSCFHLKKIPWYRNLWEKHWLTDVEVFRTHMNCVVDACIRSADASVFLELAKPLEPKELAEYGYVKGQTVALFGADSKRDYFCSAREVQRYGSLFSPAPVGRTSAAVVFFSHDAGSIVQVAGYCLKYD